METIVITGAGSGIGFSLAQKLLSENYRVAAWDIEPGKLASIKDENLTFNKVDVRDASAMIAATEEAASLSQGITGLATCAAIYRTAPFLDLSEADWDDHLNINLKGTMLTCQAVLPAMIELGRGSIVMFSSIIARRGAPKSAAYAATKGGVLGLCRALALDHARAGIRANVVSPGIVDTEMPRRVMAEVDMFAKGDNIPLGRIGTPEEIVEAAYFLLRDDASFITGQDIRVNGGAGLF
ncbi:MAG: Dihydroanticapsin 7-dehydrogenase [Alphaproteobacteria bacterium MarineAlpha11_Bin1]|nr:MAG: Dihydroanticapsin 7-dehydrogenase [Alphaproteobacteria bacterium MarineAlpha11_Bin1]|tara:strand:- start:5275 stop:5991 length:717 start_codon:yes stop_codon:yes gene_type:complete